MAHNLFIGMIKLYIYTPNWLDMSGFIHPLFKYTFLLMETQIVKPEQ